MTYTNATSALRIVLASALVSAGFGALTPGGAGPAIEGRAIVATAPAPGETLPTPTTTTSATTTLAFGAAGETTISTATAQQAEQVEWALSRFAEAGLDLPAIAIYIHSDRAECNDLIGYLCGSAETGWILHSCDSCGVDFTLLHELAHAWDNHSLDGATRTKFLKLAQADTWSNSDNWYLAGGEHAANVIAWALMDERINQTSTRPYDYSSMLKGYDILTGGQPLWLEA